MFSQQFADALDVALRLGERDMGTITNLEKRLERIEQLTGINEPDSENVVTRIVFTGPNGSPEDTESFTVGEDSARTVDVKSDGSAG